MSERGKWSLLALCMFIAFVVYSEVDSWFWRSQIRDLQRRVGQLESERR